MINPSGFRSKPGEEVELEEVGDGLFAICNSYVGEYDYFKDPVLERIPPEESWASLENVTSTIGSQINGVYVQQFLANLVSVLQSCKALAKKTQRLPELLSAYPRRLLERTLDDDELDDLIESVATETSITMEEVKTYVRRHLDEFLITQRNSMVYGYEKLDIRGVVQEMEENYPEFYQFRPLHESDLKGIFQGEGIQVIYLDRLPVLAALITYVDNQGDRVHAVLVRSDSSVPQWLREFAMAHELGHWFAHIKRKLTDTVDHLDFYLHSFHDLGPFENEANKIALLTLFPTPYLSWCDLDGVLSPDQLLSEFTQGKENDLGTRLKRNMKSFIERRIETYHKYRRLWLEVLRLPSVPMQESALPMLIETFFTDFRWAILDPEYHIVDSSEGFAQLVGLTRDELLSKQRHINELTETSAQATTLEQLEKKRRDLIPKFYITKYKNSRTGDVLPVTIYAFPIVDHDKHYKGSFGIVTDIRDGIWNRRQ